MAPERTEPGRRQICAAAALLLVAGCAGPPSTTVRPAGPGGAPESPPAGAAPTVPPEVPSRPSLGLFSRIKAPSEVEPVFALAATGVQIFRCEPDKEGYHWVFRLPEAELRDGRGQVVAHHGANYSFEHVDGSRPQLGMALPAIQIFTVKQLNGLGFSLAGRHDRGHLLGRFLLGGRAFLNQEERGPDAEQSEQADAHNHACHAVVLPVNGRAWSR